MLMRIKEVAEEDSGWLSVQLALSAKVPLLCASASQEVQIHPFCTRCRVVALKAPGFNRKGAGRYSSLRDSSWMVVVGIHPPPTPSPSARACTGSTRGLGLGVWLGDAVTEEDWLRLALTLPVPEEEAPADSVPLGVAD